MRCTKEEFKPFIESLVKIIIREVSIVTKVNKQSLWYSSFDVQHCKILKFCSLAMVEIVFQAAKIKVCEKLGLNLLGTISGTVQKLVTSTVLEVVSFVLVKAKVLSGGDRRTD